MLAALHVLAALGGQDRSLSQLMADYQRYAASGEINFRVDDAPKCVAAVLDSFADRTVATDGLDGVTVDLGDGAWFNLRTSNTEPLLRLNVEARTAAAVDAIVTQAAERISAT
jgi:phosphomannomutase